MIRSAAICLMALMLLAGCSRQQPGSDVTLRWSGFASPGYDTMRQELSRQFEAAHPGVKVHYEPIAALQYQSKILTQLAGGTAPDVFFIPNRMIGDFISKKALLDLTGYIQRDSDYFSAVNPIVMKSHRFDGRYFSLPGNCSTFVLYYNKALFDGGGIAYPDATWTWDDMAAAARKLTEKDAAGRTIKYGMALGAFSNTIPVEQSGTRIWDEAMTKCVINTGTAVHAIKFFKTVWHDDKAAPSSLDPNFDYNGQVSSFMAGNIAMICLGTSQASNFDFKGSRIRWGASVPPFPDGGTVGKGIPLTGLYIGVNGDTKHRDLAYELARYLMSPDVMKQLVKIGDSLPLRLNGAEAEEFMNSSRPDSYKQACLQLMKQATPDRINTKVSELYQQEIIKETFDNFNAGQYTASEAMKKIAERLNEQALKRGRD